MIDFGHILKLSLMKHKLNKYVVVTYKQIGATIDWLFSLFEKLILDNL